MLIPSNANFAFVIPLEKDNPNGEENVKLGSVSRHHKELFSIAVWKEILNCKVVWDSMTVERPIPKSLPRPITTEAKSKIKQSEFLPITCNLLEAREKSRVRGAISFGSHRLKYWREIF